MPVYRTVQIADDQLPRFEKMMEENGFEIILTEAPEIPLEVQREMERRWETRHERPQHGIEEVETMLRSKDWIAKCASGDFRRRSIDFSKLENL